MKTRGEKSEEYGTQFYKRLRNDKLNKMQCKVIRNKNLKPYCTHSPSYLGRKMKQKGHLSSGFQGSLGC
jgi:hypothetical protein